MATGIGVVSIFLFSYLFGVSVHAPAGLALGDCEKNKDDKKRGGDSGTINDDTKLP